MSKHQPALLGGLFIGVLSVLPVVNMANYCCCLWVVAGGVLVVYLQQQGKPTPVETGEAVGGGLLAGLVGAVITSVVVFVMLGLGNEAIQEGLREALSQNPDLPPGMRDTITSLLTSRNLGLMVAFVTLPVYAVFGMLGSLLGLAFFRKKTPPAPPVQG
jgi:uncharacterized membrane protein YqgA involved in biofilm formation